MFRVPTELESPGIQEVRETWGILLLVRETWHVLSWLCNFYRIGYFKWIQM